MRAWPVRRADAALVYGAHAYTSGVLVNADSEVVRDEKGDPSLDRFSSFGIEDV